MNKIYNHEMKLNLKSLLIWFICVGGIGFACILLFSNLQTDMEDMADMFSSMGAFSDAFGMSQLSIATITGFYATEVGTIHSLGGAMFAAIISTNMLSKEEDGHTSEFLFSLPISRSRVVLAKWCAVITNIVLFNVLCVILYGIGIGLLGESISYGNFILYHTMQIVMQIELSIICYAISAASKKNRLGVGLGVVLLFYAYDLTIRIIPDIEKYKIVSPFSYANAADILSTGKLEIAAIMIGIILSAIGLFATFSFFTKKDLRS